MVLGSKIFFCHTGEVADLRKEVADLRAAQQSSKQQMKKELKKVMKKELKKEMKKELKKEMDKEMKAMKTAVSRCVTIYKVNMSYPEILCIAHNFSKFTN